MFLTCYKKGCNFFMWIDPPISHGMKERLSYLPEPQVVRFLPYGDKGDVLENDAKRKHLSNTSAIHAKMTKSV